MTPAQPSAPDAFASAPSGLVLAGALRRSGERETLSRMARLVDGGALAAFMLAVGTLILRPADLFPALAGVPVYEWLISACIVTSLPRVVERFRTWLMVSGRVSAGTALVCLLVPAVVLSHLWHASTYEARVGGMEMAKGCTLFLLTLALVDTTARLRAVLAGLVAAVLAITALAVLQYHGVIDLPVATSIAQRPPYPSEAPAVVRLCSIGVFSDPNDFSMILVMAMAACGYLVGGGLGEAGMGRVRWVLLLPILLFGYALLLTHSRGGAISAVAALMAFATARMGWRNSLPFACVLIPLLVAMIPGRQGGLNLGDPEDTFQTRIELWRQSLDLFRSTPLLGIGQGKLVDAIGAVSHNSYLHAFAEMGLFGGIAFLGAFSLLVRGVWSAAPAEPAAARLRPYVLAMIVAYAVGLLSLSRCYAVTTQLALGLAAAYVAIAAHGRPLPGLDLRCLQRITALGLVFLASTYVFVRIMLQQGQP